MEIRALLESDARKAFSSGDADLDRFFIKYAGQNQFRHHIGMTYVAVEADVIYGFATLSSGHVEIDELSEPLAKRLPRYPLPILRLARIAVATNAQGKGVGGALLHAVCRLALSQADVAGCVGVVVDAKLGAVGWYERYGFIAMRVVEGESAARPRPQAMFLSLAAIREAMG